MNNANANAMNDNARWPKESQTFDFYHFISLLLIDLMYDVCKWMIVKVDGQMKWKWCNNADELKTI